MEQVLGPLGVSCTVKSQEEFHAVLKDGTLLCELMNTLSPGSVKNINRSQIEFKQRENIEVYLEAAHKYGQKEVDAYLVDDLYLGKNLHLVINNLHNLGGLAQKHGFKGPAFGGRRAVEQKYNFDEETIRAGKAVNPLIQSGSNNFASQKGMTASGTARDIRLEDEDGKVIGTGKDESSLSLQSGSNKGASQAGMAAPGTARDIRVEDVQGKEVDVRRY